MLNNTIIMNNLNIIKKEINEACKIADRKESAINLVAVSKTIGATYICEAAEYGQVCFGENKVQEAVKKWPPIKKAYPKTRLHMIGPLQSNKVKGEVPAPALGDHNGPGQKQDT